MATFVLVHGSFHGAWCWERLTPLLTQRGHRVVASDLPGSSDDPAPRPNVGLRSYATRIAAFAVVVFLQRHIVRGLTLGAVKG